MKDKINHMEEKVNNTPTGLSGAAKLEAPAAMQKVEYIEDPGKGRILVDTKPLMGVVFQDAANTAVYIAQKKTAGSFNTLRRQGIFMELLL